MESKFTKGKWELVKSDFSLFTNIVCGETRIAEVKHFNDPEDLDNKFINDPIFLEGKANAKLIASAPEMFEMLKKLLESRLRFEIDYIEIKQLLTKITSND